MAANIIRRSSIPCKQTELRLDFALQGGQSFRWEKTGDGEWTGVVGDRIWTLSQDEDRLFYGVHPEPQTSAEKTSCERFLNGYFQLDVKLSDLYAKWSLADAQFNRIASSYPGVRVLRQDPVENLFSFLCSSNNNIKRITGMVENLCVLYGKELWKLNGKTYNSFPDLERLASSPDVVEQLKEKKFGYRAGFIYKTAKKIVSEHGGSSWLYGLRDVPFEEAREALMTLPGVGPKVADCICLMSLDKSESVPVDTHIFKLASHLYFADEKTPKTLTKGMYKEIGVRFRDIFGDRSGWAHSVLFTSDLGQFQIAKPSNKRKDRDAIGPKKTKVNKEEELELKPLK